MKIIKMSIQINFSLVLNRNKVLSSPTPLGAVIIHLYIFISVTLVEALFYCHVLLKMCRKINQAYTFDFLFLFGELYYTTCIFTTTEYDFCLFVCVSEKEIIQESARCFRKS